MKLKYIIEKISENGTRDVLSVDYEKPELTIGRGSGCDIRLPSNYVSLLHAKIGFKGDIPYIEDPGSLSTVIVNGNIEKYKTLKAGDKIKLADITLEVVYEDGVWGLKEVRREADQTGMEEMVARQASRLNIYNLMPSFLFLSSALFILTAAWFFIIPYFTDVQESWSTGELSSHHSMISKDCKACHSGGFVQVEDKKCLTCHNMTEHSEFLKNHKDKEPRCASCHMEHNKEHVVLSDSRICLDCHADIQGVNPESQHPDVPSFEKHPEFLVAVQVPGGAPKKVRLDDKENLKDTSNIKLNHKIHLEPIRSKDGTVNLHCRDCHNASPDRTSIEKIDFDKHCRSCHTLEFDERLRGQEVPHEQPDIVYKYLYAEYAKLMLSSDDSQGQQDDFNRRFRPGQALPSVQNLPSAKDDFKQAFVEQESRRAEEQLFTKTACYLCHTVNAKAGSAADYQAGATSRYEVVKPEIPTDWMPAARYDHGAHEAIKCESCHKGVRQSIETVDVLLPKVEDCRTCHIDTFKHGLVKSDCVSCHSYHDQELVDPQKKRAIQELLQYVH